METYKKYLNEAKVIDFASGKEKKEKKKSLSDTLEFSVKELNSIFKKSNAIDKNASISKIKVSGQGRLIVLVSDSKNITY